MHLGHSARVLALIHDLHHKSSSARTGAYTAIEQPVLVGHSETQSHIEAIYESCC